MSYATVYKSYNQEQISHYMRGGLKYHLMMNTLVILSFCVVTGALFYFSFAKMLAHSVRERSMALFIERP